MWRVGHCGCACPPQTSLALEAGIRWLRSSDKRKLLLAYPPISESGKHLGNELLCKPALDELDKFCGTGAWRRLQDDRKLELVASDRLRGLSLVDSFVVLDEAQNASATLIKHVTERLSDGSKLVIIGDPKRQIDRSLANWDHRALLEFVHAFEQKCCPPHNTWGCVLRFDGHASQRGPAAAAMQEIWGEIDTQRAPDESAAGASSSTAPPGRPGGMAVRAITDLRGEPTRTSGSGRGSASSAVDTRVPMVAAEGWGRARADGAVAKAEAERKAKGAAAAAAKAEAERKAKEAAAAEAEAEAGRKAAEAAAAEAEAEAGRKAKEAAAAETEAEAEREAKEAAAAEATAEAERKASEVAAKATAEAERREREVAAETERKKWEAAEAATRALQAEQRKKEAAAAVASSEIEQWEMEARAEREAATQCVGCSSMVHRGRRECPICLEPNLRPPPAPRSPSASTAAALIGRSASALPGGSLGTHEAVAFAGNGEAGEAPAVPRHALAFGETMATCTGTGVAGAEAGGEDDMAAVAPGAFPAHMRSRRVTLQLSFSHAFEHGTIDEVASYVQCADGFQFEVKGSSSDTGQTPVGGLLELSGTASQVLSAHAFLMRRQATLAEQKSDSARPSTTCLLSPSLVPDGPGLLQSQISAASGARVACMRVADGDTWCSINGTLSQIHAAIRSLLAAELRLAQPPPPVTVVKSEGAISATTTPACISPGLAPLTTHVEPPNAASADGATEEAIEATEQLEIRKEVAVAPMSPPSDEHGSQPASKYTRSSGTTRSLHEPGLSKGDRVRVKWYKSKTPIGACRDECIAIPQRSCCKWYAGRVRDLQKQLVSDRGQATYQIFINYDDGHKTEHDLMRIVCERLEDEEQEEESEEEEEEAACVDEAEGYRLLRSDRGATGYKGVTRVGRTYRSCVTRPGQKKAHLGTFATALEAAVAVAKAIAEDEEGQGEEDEEAEVMMDKDAEQEDSARSMPRENSLRADVLSAVLAGKCSNDDIVEYVRQHGKATTRGDGDVKMLRGDVVTLLSKEKRADLPLWVRKGDGATALTCVTDEGRKCGRAMPGNAQAMSREAQGTVLCGINGCPLVARHAGSCAIDPVSGKRMRGSVAQTATQPKRQCKERAPAPSHPAMVPSVSGTSAAAATPAAGTSTPAASTSMPTPTLPAIVKRLRAELELCDDMTFKEVVESAERQLLGEMAMEGVPLIKRARHCLNELGAE